MKRLVYLGGFIFLCWMILWSTTACETPPNPPTPVPSPTAVQRGFQRLAIPVAGGLLPSPDGTLLAGLDLPARMLTLYDLTGQVRGQYKSPGGVPLNMRWLSDSSGLFVWNDTPKPGPLPIVDRQGKGLATGLEGSAPALSPDGAWVAANRLGSPPEQNAVEVIPRSGGAVRTLVQGSGVQFLGWQGDHVISFAPGGIYVIPAMGGESKLLTSVSAGEELLPPPLGPASSPDGQVLVLSTGRQVYLTLIGTQLRPYPPVSVPGTPVFWTGPHQALGLSPQNELLLLDMVSGTVERHTGAYAPGGVEAVSGTWVAWITEVTSEESTLHLTNFQTRVALDLGKPPVSGLIYSLGKGRFVLHGEGKTYIIDPSLAGS